MSRSGLILIVLYSISINLQVDSTFVGKAANVLFGLDIDSNDDIINNEFDNYNLTSKLDFNGNIHMDMNSTEFDQSMNGSMQNEPTSPSPSDPNPESELLAIDRHKSNLIKLTILYFVIFFLFVFAGGVIVYKLPDTKNDNDFRLV